MSLGDCHAHLNKKPGSDYALPGLRYRYVPVSRPGKHSATGQQDSAQQLESNHPDNRADRAEDSFHHRPGLQRLRFGRAGKLPNSQKPASLT